MHNERYETVLPDRLRRRYRSPAPPPYIRRPKPKRRVWPVFSAALICWAVIIASALLFRHEMPAQTSQKNPSTRRRGFWDAPTPVPLPTPTPIPTPVVEVRKAGYVLHRQVIMPDKTSLTTRYLGSVPDQESLPLTGNHIGDAYSVGTYEFVWVSPGVWIDPVN